MSIEPGWTYIFVWQFSNYTLNVGVGDFSSGQETSNLSICFRFLKQHRIYLYHLTQTSLSVVYYGGML